MATRDLEQIHETALRRFKLTALAEQKQRQRELEDLKFADPIDPDDQWPSDALDARAGLPAGASGLPAVPARPALTINKLRQPIQQVQAQQRSVRLAVEFAPEGGTASMDDAEAFEDIARAIQSDSRAHLARNWAFDRAIRCGRGFYRIETEYVSDRSFDQRICYQRILNQFAVFFYPFCQEPDYSDAEWCFITEDVPLEEYRRCYPESSVAAMDDEELAAVGTDAPGWIGESDDGKTVRIAEYYYFEHTPDTLVAIQTPQGPQAVLKSELPTAYTPAMGPTGTPLERPVDRRQLCWCKLNAVEILTDEGYDSPIVERDGKYIPVIPVIGDESNINGDRRYTGIVRPARDAQRLFNVEASTLAEAVHLGPLSPFIGYAEQFEGYDAWWSQLNIRRFPYLPVNPARDAAGAPLPLPQRNTAEQPIQAIVVSLQQAGSYIHDTTGIPPVALGDLDPQNRSGKAILALQKQSEQGTSGYVDNLANMSLLLEGKILRDLIPTVYDRPGRPVPAQGDDDERRVLLLNAPFVEDPTQGPRVVPPHAQGAKVIDLKKGEYSVSATVGKSFTTRREEAVSQLGELAGAVPGLVPAFADIWVQNMDGPGFRQIGDRLARAVPPQFKDPQAGQNDPAALQQQLAQAQQILQTLSQELQAKTQIIQTDTIKAQQALQEKQLDAQARIEVAKIQAGAQMAVADLKATLDAQVQAAKASAEQLRTLIDAAEETRKAREQHMHDLETLGHEHAHDVAMAALEHQHALTQTAQAGQIASDAAVQQAALNPPQDEGAAS